VILAVAGLLAGLADAAPAATVGWVRVQSQADADRARAAGLGFLESRRGAWVEVDTDDQAGVEGVAARAGLPWRADPPGVESSEDSWGGGGSGRPLRNASPAPPASVSPERVETRLAAIVEAGAGAWVDLGTSVDGRPIVGVRMEGAGPRTRSVRVLGGHHGDETSSVEVALAVAEDLARNGIPDGLEVWIVPTVNPDGLAARTRRNARNVDLNRNYGVRWNPTEPGAGTGAFSEPETAAVRAMADLRDWAGGLSLHGGATNLGWVWNWTTAVRPTEETALEALAEEYAAACGAPGFWVTSGGDWYVTFGDTTDWTYGAFGQHDYTLEVTEDKSPPDSARDAYVGWHLPAVRAWLARAPAAERSVVDAESGLAVPARVEADGLGAGTTGPDGRWARWFPADGAVRVSAPGYVSEDTTQTRVALVQTGAWSSLALRPPLLRQGPDARVLTVPGLTAAAPLVLSRPGVEDVTPAPAPGGGWTIVPGALSPGAWTATIGDQVLPRALVVLDDDGTVGIDAIETDETSTQLAGRGFGRGSEAFALVGPARAPVPVAVRGVSDDRLTLAGLPDDTRALLVWTRGHWRAVDAPRGDAVVEDTQPPAGALYAPGVCGPADTRGGRTTGTVAVLLAGLLTLRRGPGRCGGGQSPRPRRDQPSP
jgi:hypothetical protein